MKRFIHKITAASALLLLLSACGGEPEQNAATERAASSQNPTYRVYTQAFYPPYVMMEEGSTEHGFEYEILQAVAQKQHFDLHFSTRPWELLFPALDANEADILSAGITATEERKEKMDFTEPFFVSRMALLLPEKSDIQSAKQLNGKKVGVKSGTTHDQFLAALAVQPQKKATVWLAVRELMNEHADAVIGDYGTLSHYAKQYPDYRFRILPIEEAPKENLAFAVRKGNTELLNKLNAGLQQIRADGTYQKIHDKWLGGTE